MQLRPTRLKKNSGPPSSAVCCIAGVVDARITSRDLPGGGGCFLRFAPSTRFVCDARVEVEENIRAACASCPARAGAPCGWLLARTRAGRPPRHVPLLLPLARAAGPIGDDVSSSSSTARRRLEQSRVPPYHWIAGRRSTDITLHAKLRIAIAAGYRATTTGR
jgi:hypothetical protein